MTVWASDVSEKHVGVAKVDAVVPEITNPTFDPQPHTMSSLTDGAVSAPTVSIRVAAGTATGSAKAL